MKLIIKKEPERKKRKYVRKKPFERISAKSVLEYRAVEQMTLKDARKAARDIGFVPMVQDHERRDSTYLSLRLFCEIYFPEQFTLAWSPDHLMVIEKMEQAVLHGGLFAMAMPRGSGKTTLTECAGLWAILHGHRKFVVVIGATQTHAAEIVESLKTELETNELLLQDFPETLFPIHALEGIAHRCNGQLCEGERTYIGWTADELILPTVKPSRWANVEECSPYLKDDGSSRASGAIIRVAGITGRIRGMKFKKPSGESTRPDFVILDDPQTDDSARSVSQSQEREAIIAGAVLGLGGPGKKIAAVMPCTVVRPGDMVDRLLDHNKHPQWNGTRTKMVYAWPRNEKIWDDYARIRADNLRANGKFERATEFYRQNRPEMDEGSRVAWPERFNSDEISALQHAMNKRLDDEAAFFAEYQNDPLPEENVTDEDLTSDLVLTRLSGYERLALDEKVTRITGFIDIQQKCLWYVLCAWSDNCDGWIIDYNTMPDQHRMYYTLRDAKVTLATQFAGMNLEAQLYHGIESTVQHILGRRYKHPSGVDIPVEAILIDANWEQSTDTVYSFCRQTQHSNIVRPSHGRYVGASTRPMAEWEKQPGERIGTGWRLSMAKKGLRSVQFDANFWKTWAATRILTAPGDRGAITLWGKSPDQHKVIADHFASEHRIRTTGRGRTLDEWKLKPGRDNHYWDGIIGCAVGANLVGMADAPGGISADKESKRVASTKKKFSEMQREAQAKRGEVSTGREVVTNRGQMIPRR